jgi:NAD(P)-dependent dehydrogenase (short-subunit alcohol dehydrogenase family)
VSVADSTVVVAGGSSGIGFATAALAAEHGARVIVMSRTQAKLDAAVAKIPGARGIAVDFTDAESVARAFGALGTIDHLVATAVHAEYGLFGALGSLTETQIEASFDKLRGFVHVARAAAPKLAERGTMTFLSGAGAVRPPKDTALAAAANGSVVSFARALAIDLAPRRINVVMPGAVDTAVHGEAYARVAAWARTLPAGHFGTPADIAAAVMFLMENPYMTGHTLVIDGGLLGS